jgi:hypothetical protein
MTWNDGPCGSFPNLCTGNASVTFKVDGNAIDGTLARVWYTSGGQTIANSYGAAGDPRPGDQFTLSVASQDVLHTTWLGSDASVLNAGNPNWCRTGYTNTAVCGA